MIIIIIITTIISKTSTCSTLLTQISLQISGVIWTHLPEALGVDGWKHLCNNSSQPWHLYKKKQTLKNKSHCGSRTLLKLLLELNLFQMMLQNYFP
jgi:hypothetical protein